MAVGRSILPWSKLRGIGNSPAIKVTILLPVIGYLILFNDNVAKGLDLAREATGVEPKANGVPPRLMLVYIGLCAVAVGTTMYSIFCPKDVKHYGISNSYVLGDGQAVKDWEFEAIEETLRHSSFTPEYQKVRNRWDVLTSDVDPEISERKAQMNNAILHLYFQHQDDSKPLARWMTALG